MGEEKTKTAREITKKVGIKGPKKPLIVGVIIAAIAITGIVGGIYLWSIIPSPTRHELFVGVYERWPVTYIDPLYAFLIESGMTCQIAETLVEDDYSEGEPQIVPNLATEWDWNENATELTFYLREGVRFHDGTPFNASAVQWNWDRIHQTMNLPMQGHSYLFTLEDGRLIVNKTQVIDEYTIKFVLNEPFVPFLALLTHYGTSIISPTSSPSDEFFTIEDSVLVGTGPFIFDEFEPAINLTMNRNANYWGEKPKVDKLIFSFYSNRDDLWDAMLLKNISMIDPFVFWDYYDPQYPNGTIANFWNNPEFIVQEEIDKLTNYIGMKNNIINVTMRKAISYAINYTYIIEKIGQNRAVRSKSCIPEYMFYSNTTAFNMPYYNISKARQVLIDEGWPGTAGLTANDNISMGNEWEVRAINGPPLATYNHSYFDFIPTQNLSANLLYENLKQIGVNLTLRGDLGPWFAKQDIYVSNFFPDYLDPGVYSNWELAVDTEYIQFTDTNSTQWMEEALGVLNETARKQLYFKIQKRIIEDVYPMIWTMNWKKIYISVSNLKGLQYHPFKFLLKTVYFD